MTFFDEFYVDFTIEKLEMSKDKVKGKRLRLTIHPKQDIVIQGVDIQIDNKYKITDKLFCNGYQSWSESREFSIQERILPLRKIGRPLKYWMGDEHIGIVKRAKGWLHSWAYSYIRSGANFLFLGSLSEKNAFTLIQHNTSADKLHLQPDCENLSLQHSFHLLDFVILEGAENQCFDSYFSLAEIEKPKAKPAIGWTSWYYHYTNISEKIILDNLAIWKKVEARKATYLPESSLEINQIFQIDDGWQKAVGDWLDVTDSFPNGMSVIASKIKENGYIPGLWLSPFVVDTRSVIFKNNKNWLVKDDKNKPLRIGYTPLWKGGFYALDFYQKEVQDYLTKVLLTVTQKWGFSMLKLDFLYAVCIRPRSNKTRGQIMTDALTFIRDLVGESFILGCGVPLSSAFGLVDYCRIGADIHLEWEHNLLRFLRDRERVSTIVSLRTTLGRWHLNNRAFLNDPDVFILRKEKNKLTPTQQYSILMLNTLLGNLVFTSDDLKEYDSEQLEEFYEVERWLGAEIKSVKQYNKDKYEILFHHKRSNYVAFSNLSKKEEIFEHKGGKVSLLAYETLLLKG